MISSRAAGPASDFEIWQTTKSASDFQIWQTTKSGAETATLPYTRRDYAKVSYITRQGVGVVLRHNQHVSMGCLHVSQSLADSATHVNTLSTHKVQQCSAWNMSDVALKEAGAREHASSIPNYSHMFLLWVKQQH